MKKQICYILFLHFGLIGCKSMQQAKKCVDENGKVDITISPIDGPSVISGMVRDMDTGELLPYVTIVLSGHDGNNQGVISDSEGRFSMYGVFKLGDCGLAISCMGYQEIEIPLNITKPSSIRLDIRLKKYVSQVEKPVIYLYPTSKQTVTVALEYAGELTHTYPAYPTDGWVVTAEPDGVLHDEKGEEYYALFWEGIPAQQLRPEDGFIVPGNETAGFLEEKLAYLGLNRREANEFIMYWLPRMESNPYNLIHFSGEEYDKTARLKVTPSPETVIRVMMLTQPLSHTVDFPLQDLSSLKKDRKGFTLVEWGGSVVEAISM
jgi:hypothetical protein